MTMSWHMMVDFNPPLIACVVSNGDYSFTALRARKECVIAIPDVTLAEIVVGIGNCSGRDTDKFTEIRADCAARRRCRRAFDRRGVLRILKAKCAIRGSVNKYCIFILEVVKAWETPAKAPPKTLHHRGYGTFAVDGDIIHLASDKP